MHSVLEDKVGITRGAMMMTLHDNDSTEYLPVTKQLCNNSKVVSERLPEATQKRPHEDSGHYCPRISASSIASIIMEERRSISGKYSVGFGSSSWPHGTRYIIEFQLLHRICGVKHISKKASIKLLRKNCESDGDTSGRTGFVRRIFVFF